MKKALVIIDIQNDITKNYKEIIGGIRTIFVIEIQTHYDTRHLT
jgi:nicotinamidase-related amidase